MFQVKPFRGETLATLSYQITQEPPTPASQQNPLVPSACDRILSKALAKVSTDRYPRGKELAQALRRVLQDIKKALPSLDFRCIAIQIAAILMHEDKEG